MSAEGGRPLLAYVKKALTVAGENLALEIVMMVGCGLRNGEARAVHINNVLPCTSSSADDVYRVHEQIHSHTQAGEARGTAERGVPRGPSARWVREAVERMAILRQGMGRRHPHIIR